MPTGSANSLNYPYQKDSLLMSVRHMLSGRECFAVPPDEPVATIFSNSNATMAGLLRFSQNPHTYEFKE